MSAARAGEARARREHRRLVEAGGARWGRLRRSARADVEVAGSRSAAGAVAPARGIGRQRVTLAAAMHLSVERDGDELEVELAGNWRGADLPAIDAELA